MSRTKGAFKLWTPGESLRAPKLNQTIPFLNELHGLQPPRQSTEQGIPENENTAADEVWVFAASETETTRIYDASDPEVYVDVEKTTAVTVTKPDGLTVRIELEASEA